MPYTPQQLSDLESIRDAVKRYSHGLDRLDAEHMRSAYWPDAVDDHGPEGRQSGWEYVDLAMGSHVRWRCSLHTLLNHVIELDANGTDAAGEMYVIAYLFLDERPVLHTWFGRYLDRYQQRDGEWRILERVVVHEGNTTADPLPTMPFPMDAFVPGSFDRPSSGRPIGPGPDSVAAG